jgi:hypothetical protein
LIDRFVEDEAAVALLVRGGGIQGRYFFWGDAEGDGFQAHF